jgi:hypothetical protein
MDFSKTDIIKILKASFSNRFSDFPPTDFEDFMAQLFKDNGYEVKQTSYSGDYGADLIIVKNSEMIAVQVKRYAEDNNVGVRDINQVIGAKKYYQCHRAIIITTSSYTKAGSTLATKTGVELWDWNKLQKYICDTYLGGKDYYSYFGEGQSYGEYQIVYGGVLLSFTIKTVEFHQSMEKVGLCTSVHIEINNNNNKNIDLEIGSAIYITRNNNQIKSVCRNSQYFTNGVIYAGCVAEIVFCFPTDLLNQVELGDKIIIPFNNDVSGYQEQEVPFKIEYEIETKKESCYIVTYCFGRDSIEYNRMILFRDEYLSKYTFGRLFIRSYYNIGPRVVAYLSNTNIIHKPIQLILRFLINIVLKVMK